MPKVPSHVHEHRPSHVHEQPPSPVHDPLPNHGHDQLPSHGRQRLPGHVRERAKSWRREIVQARIKLADANLSRAQRLELWQIVDCREWCLKVLVPDFTEELERIDREIEHALRR